MRVNVDVYVHRTVGGLVLTDHATSPTDTALLTFSAGQTQAPPRCKKGLGRTELWVKPSVRIGPESVQVVSEAIAAVVAQKNAIRIQHRDDLKNEAVSEGRGT